MNKWDVFTKQSGFVIATNNLKKTTNWLNLDQFSPFCFGLKWWHKTLHSSHPASHWWCYSSGLLMRKSSSCTEENSKLLSFHPHTALQVLTRNGKLSLQEMFAGVKVSHPTTQRLSVNVCKSLCNVTLLRSSSFTCFISELAWNVNFLQSLTPPTHSPCTAPRNVLFPFTSQLLCVCVCVSEWEALTKDWHK